MKRESKPAAINEKEKETKHVDVKPANPKTTRTQPQGGKAPRGGKSKS